MKNMFASEYAGHDVLHPVGLLAIIVLGIFMLICQRRNAVLPMILMACFIAPAQRLVIFSLNFDLLRIMVLFASIRVLINSEWKNFRWITLDYVFLAWGAVSLFNFTLVYGTVEAVKYQLGLLYDAMGMYFIFRMLIKSWQDYDQIITQFAIVSIPVAIAFLIEHATARNLFAFLGGVPEVTDIRDGRLRCQGAFAHSILAGCFWASIMPMFAARFFARREKRLTSIIGLACASIIVIMCASSTPVMAVIFAIVAGCIFPFRRRLRLIRWSLLGGVIALHLMMKAPVWELIARVDLAGGSTGWHRFYLIDRAIQNFNEWGLIGSDKGTEHWGYGMGDVTNFYLVQGLHGGMPQLCLFVAIISFAFSAAGKIIRPTMPMQRVRDGYALGVSLLTHAASFLSISYFGQINMIWYLLLACIGSLSIAPIDSQPTVPVHRKRTLIFVRPRNQRVQSSFLIPVRN